MLLFFCFFIIEEMKEFKVKQALILSYYCCQALSNQTLHFKVSVYRHKSVSNTQINKHVIKNLNASPFFFCAFFFKSDRGKSGLKQIMFLQLSIMGIIFQFVVSFIF